MKLLFLLLFFCASHYSGSAQLSLSDTNSDRQRHKEFLNNPWKSWYANGQLLDSGALNKNIPDGIWITWYPDGQAQFIRNYSSEKWQQFQNEKSRYHEKRIPMPITKLFHENKKQTEKYTTAINSFCGVPNCTHTNETLQQLIDNNTKQHHYHPPFENGLLDGVFVNYFPDGAVRDSGFYKNGLPEGIWIKWTDDKQFYWKGYYHHGLKNKEWKLYSSTGKLIRILFYKEGKYLWRKDLLEARLTEEEVSSL